MAGLPPLALAPGAFPSTSPSPSNMCLKSTCKAGDTQPQAMPATMASKDGGEPQHDMNGGGRVGEQGIDGCKPPSPRPDGSGDTTMCTDAAGGKRPQTPQSKNDSLVKKRKKHNNPTTIKVPDPQLLLILMSGSRKLLSVGNLFTFAE